MPSLGVCIPHRFSRDGQMPPNDNPESTQAQCEKCQRQVKVCSSLEIRGQFRDECWISSTYLIQELCIQAETLMSKAWFCPLLRRPLWSTSGWYYTNHISRECAVTCMLLNSVSRGYKSSHLLKLDQRTDKKTSAL